MFCLYNIHYKLMARPNYIIAMTDMTDTIDTKDTTDTTDTKDTIDTIDMTELSGENRKGTSKKRRIICCSRISTNL